MIIQGNELSLFDLVSYYTNRNQCACLYFNLDKYNSLDATKKATVTKIRLRQEGHETHGPKRGWLHGRSLKTFTGDQAAPNFIKVHLII